MITFVLWIGCNLAKDARIFFYIKMLVRDCIMSNVIFLDVDGVLNSKFWDNEHQREISNGKYIDSEAVKLLGSLVKRTNAKIILHK